MTWNKVNDPLIQSKGHNETHLTPILVRLVKQTNNSGKLRINNQLLNTRKQTNLAHEVETFQHQLPTFHSALSSLTFHTLSQTSWFPEYSAAKKSHRIRFSQAFVWPAPFYARIQSTFHQQTHRNRLQIDDPPPPHSERPFGATFHSNTTSCTQFPIGTAS